MEAVVLATEAIATVMLSVDAARLAAGRRIADSLPTLLVCHRGSQSQHLYLRHDATPHAARNRARSNRLLSRAGMSAQSRAI